MKCTLHSKALHITLFLPWYCLNRESGEEERLDDDDDLHLDNDNRPEDDYNGVRCVILNLLCCVKCHTVKAGAHN